MAKAGLHLIRTCEACGESYRQSRSDQRFCGGYCAQKHWRKQRPKKARNCGACGAQLLSDSRRYCDTACRSVAEKKRRKLKNSGLTKGWSKGKQFVPRFLCQICAAPFYAPPAQRKRGGGKFCSMRCAVKYRSTNPAFFPRSRGPRGRGGHRDDLGMYFRSSWEANYARYLNWLKRIGEIRDWEYEKQTFEFPGIKRGARFYTPDFRITNKSGSIEFSEIKGYMDARSQTKLKRMRKYYPSVKVVLVDLKAYRAIARQVGKSIPNWE